MSLRCRQAPLSSAHLRPTPRGERVAHFEGGTLFLNAQDAEAVDEKLALTTYVAGKDARAPRIPDHIARSARTGEPRVRTRSPTSPTSAVSRPAPACRADRPVPVLTGLYRADDVPAVRRKKRVEPQPGHGAGAARSSTSAASATTRCAGRSDAAAPSRRAPRGRRGCRRWRPGCRSVGDDGAVDDDDEEDEGGDDAAGPSTAARATQLFASPPRRPSTAGGDRSRRRSSARRRRPPPIRGHAAEQRACALPGGFGGGGFGGGSSKTRPEDHGVAGDLRRVRVLARRVGTP